MGSWIGIKWSAWSFCRTDPDPDPDPDLEGDARGSCVSKGDALNYVTKFLCEEIVVGDALDKGNPKIGRASTKARSTKGGGVLALSA